MPVSAASRDEPGENDVLRALSAASGMEFLPVLPAPTPEALALLPRSVAVRFSVAPFRTEPDELLADSCLWVATSNPLSFDLIDGLRFTLRREIQFVVAPPAEIQRIISDFYSQDAYGG